MYPSLGSFIPSPLIPIFWSKLHRVKLYRQKKFHCLFEHNQSTLREWYYMEKSGGKNPAFLMISNKSETECFSKCLWRKSNATKAISGTPLVKRYWFKSSIFSASLSVSEKTSRESRVSVSRVHTMHGVRGGMGRCVEIGKLLPHSNLNKLKWEWNVVFLFVVFTSVMKLLLKRL